MEHPILSRVFGAKEDPRQADDLIRDYIPFIRAEASKAMGRVCTEQDDEFSVAMIAFHEAVQGYEQGRGTFLAYAAVCIRSRIIDPQRKEARHQGGISLHQTDGEDDRPLLEELADQRDHYEEMALRDATRQEIEELSRVMARFGVSFSDVADQSPKQERTLAACGAAVRYAGENQPLLEELLRTGKLPLARLAAGAGVERKTLERHRKYVLAMLLIQTNGYEIIRGHLKRVLTRRGGMAG